MAYNFKQLESPVPSVGTAIINLPQVGDNPPNSADVTGFGKEFNFFLRIIIIYCSRNYWIYSISWISNYLQN